MSARRFSQHSTEVLDYDFDFTNWIGSDEITGTSVAATPTGLTVTSEISTTKIAKVWCSGGTVGTTYDVTVQIETLAGRTKERCIEVKITDCCES
jgi:hypothetical protein